MGSLRDAVITYYHRSFSKCICIFFLFSGRCGRQGWVSFQERVRKHYHIVRKKLYEVGDNFGISLNMHAEHVSCVISIVIAVVPDNLLASSVTVQDIMQNLQDSTEPAPAQLFVQYPSMLCLVAMPSPDDSASVRALQRCALLTLEARHSSGVHLVVPPIHSVLYDVCLTSGFTDVSVLWKRKDGSKVLGKRLSNVE